MTPERSPVPDDFREQVSAWHDRALSDEAARFVSRRLMQDEALRSAVGRWQAYGDVLRRQPAAATSASLADRIGRAIAAEDVREAASPRGVGLGRWSALAAAVALAAILVVAPFEAPTEALTSSPVAMAGGVERAAADNTALPARTVSVSSTTARAVSVIPPLAHRSASAATEPLAQVPPLVRAPQPTPEQLAPLPAAEVPSRPWPRSGAAAQAYAVDYTLPSSTRDR